MIGTPPPSISSAINPFGGAVGPQFTVAVIVSPTLAVNLYQSSRSPGSCTMPVVVLLPLTNVAVVMLSFVPASATQGALFPRRYTCDTVLISVKVTSPQAFTDGDWWSVPPGHPSKVSWPRRFE